MAEIITAGTPEHLLWLVDRQQPCSWDLIGAAVAITGVAIIMFAHDQADRNGSHANT